MSGMEKTEAPTPKRLQDARSEGQVARSIEINAALGLLMAALLLQVFGTRLARDAAAMVTDTLTEPIQTELSSTWLKEVFAKPLQMILPAVLPLLLLLMATGVLVTLTQTRFLISLKRLMPDFNRLNPVNGFKRLFSMQGVFELVKAVLKLGIVGWVTYSFVRGHVYELLDLAAMDLTSAVSQWASLAVNLALRIGATYLLLAAIDYGYQKWQYNRSLKMSKEEIKDEYKQREGDPLVRSRIRSKQRRLAMSRMMSRVPQADVIITNPTHLAIAIQYQPEAMSAPRVLAKGADKLAERIIATAQGARIPIVQNIPLARAIFKQVEIDQEIPPELYVAMAEVLAYVYKLQGSRRVV